MGIFFVFYLPKIFVFYLRRLVFFFFKENVLVVSSFLIFGFFVDTIDLEVFEDGSNDEESDEKDRIDGAYIPAVIDKFFMPAEILYDSYSFNLSATEYGMLYSFFIFAI